MHKVKLGQPSYSDRTINDCYELIYTDRFYNYYKNVEGSRLCVALHKNYIEGKNRKLIACSVWGTDGIRQHEAMPNVCVDKLWELLEENFGNNA